ncbi:MAG TPA: sulfotransferase family 2 domain-containing protein [Solirubrobacteraceae bacterium]|nr:sulfotransferase family 2 domain-containing protein [Solirubrobacteraceae bacterium]
MELSHSHRFIFIHVYRCGGESVRAAVAPYVYRPGGRLGRLRWLGRLGDHEFRRLRGQRHGHIKAKELRAALGAEDFDRFFRFAFVRNPWAWHVSIYHYVRQRRAHPQHELFGAFEGFDDYLEWRVHTVGPELQSEFILSDSGELLMDFVGHVETLEADFAEVARWVGIEASLPRTNTSQHGDFRQYYTPRTRALVADAYRDDIELFGYEFDRPQKLAPILASEAAALTPPLRGATA